MGCMNGVGWVPQAGLGTWTLPPPPHDRYRACTAYFSQCELHVAPTLAGLRQEVCSEQLPDQLEHPWICHVRDTWTHTHPCCRLDSAPTPASMGPTLHVAHVPEWLEWVLHAPCMLGPGYSASSVHTIWVNYKT